MYKFFVLFISSVSILVAVPASDDNCAFNNKNKMELSVLLFFAGRMLPPGVVRLKVELFLRHPNGESRESNYLPSLFIRPERDETLSPAPLSRYRRSKKRDSE